LSNTFAEGIPIKSWWGSAEQVIVGTRNEPNTGDERPTSAAGFDWRGVGEKAGRCSEKEPGQPTILNPALFFDARAPCSDAPKRIRFIDFIRT
jgi:hypothetical protein